MSAFVLPLVIAAVAWWFSTGAILWLVRLPSATHRWSLGVYAVVAAAATVGLMIAARDTSVTGAYVAFGCALTVWGWHEMGFLMGKLTGPRRTACPFGARGWRRFTVSAETVIHHEIALALTAVLFVALTWGQPNQTGTLTFLLLFGMRLSTKLNIFLGVPNPPVTFLPRGLAYLESYFRRARFNALFPLSLGLSIIVTLLLGEAALSTEGGAQVGHALMFMLAALGLLEHGFLMLPSPDRALWGWALGSGAAKHIQSRSSPRKRGPSALGDDCVSVNAGHHPSYPASQKNWIPAFAGMSGKWKSDDSVSGPDPTLPTVVLAKADQ